MDADGSISALRLCVVEVQFQVVPGTPPIQQEPI